MHESSPSSSLSRPAWRQWLHDYRIPLIWAVLLLLVLPMRDLWSPDEPDFAQCVREMRERGSWMLPYLNGLPYSEKPILYYWLMKISAILGEKLSGGLGFDYGIAAWALRIPSVVASIGFAFAFRRWTARFWSKAAADPATLVLCATPLWFWQSQFIQIDQLFCVLLAWSWCSFLAGYLILRDHRAGNALRWFLGAYISLALAFLAKGPLALVLSLPLLLGFLGWQRDWSALAKIRLGWGLLLMLVIISPWYIGAGIQGGATYAYEMIIHQNLERATKAWDHIQPWWYYFEYVVSHFFPWSLALPAVAIQLWKQRLTLSPQRRFAILAFVVPFLLLSCSQSKQGKYLMMVYPFLVLLLADLWGEPLSARVRRVGTALSAGIGVPALLLLAIVLFHLGGAKLQAQSQPFRGVVIVGSLILLGGALLGLHRTWRRGAFPVRETAFALGLLYLVGGTWGFRVLDPLKNYRTWTKVATPLMAGRQVYYWMTIRSGVMVYTDHLMPELRTWEDLEKRLGPEDRLVAIKRDWYTSEGGLTDARRNRLEVILRMPVGAGESLMLRRKPEPSTTK